MAKPSDDEMRRLPHRLGRELSWHADSQRYQTDDDIEAAMQAGELIEFVNTPDFARIRRFDVMAAGRTPYLAPGALHVSALFGEMWRRTLQERYGIVRSELRLAVTSMVRSQTYQADIVKAGRLAWPESTHCTGYAFDVDASGYYVVDEAGVLRPAIDLRRPAPSVADRLPRYDKRITEAALHAAQVLHNTGVINLVYEFAGTANACLHMSVSPTAEERLPV